MRVLVTGAAGYLGTEVSRVLTDGGHEVVGLDLIAHDGRDQLPGGVHVRADVRDRDAVAQALRGVDAVIHLAARSSERACDVDPAGAWSVNADATRTLGQLAADLAISRVVFASTCGVYGAGIGLDEHAAVEPRSLYASTKLAAERILLGLRDRGVRPVILRIASLFGWSRRPRCDLAVNAMTLSAHQSGRIRVHGDGSQWRPFAHVRDAARVVAWAAVSDRLAAEAPVVNLGGPRSNHRVREVAAVIQHAVPEAEVDVAGTAQAISVNYHVAFERLAELRGGETWTPLAAGVAEILDGVGSTGPATVRRAPRPRAGDAHGSTIVLGRPDITDAEVSAVVETLESGWLTTGARARELEAALQDLVGAPHVVAVSSCTAALHLALLAAEIGPGDEVITSAVTWPATANVIEHVGATPVLADVERDTLNIDPDSVARCVTPRTRAIMPVHLAGRPAALDRVHAIAARCGAVVIEDAAHALGATFAGRPIGSESPYVCFSFYPTKNVTTIEGGAIALADAERAERVRILANHGMSITAWQRHAGRVPVMPECVAPGYKYNLSDVNATLGLVQLARLPAFLAKRRALVAEYRRALAGLAAVTLLPDTDGQVHHLLPILLDVDGLGIDRNFVLTELRRGGIGASVHYRSLHLQPYYRDRYQLRPDALPVAADVSRRLLSLPLHTRMTTEDVERVVRTLESILPASACVGALA